MRTLLLVGLLAALPAFADAIGGTLGASFQGFNQYGQPTVRLSLQLTCTLRPCPATKPELHFAVSGGTNAKFLAAPTESVGYVSPFFGSDPNGDNVVDSIQFPAGSAFQLLSKSATCWCGNANGEGGYLDLTTQTVIPPWINTAGSPPKVGEEWPVLIAAMPKGSESVKLTLSGAGFNDTFTLIPSDFTSSGTGMKLIRPTQSGALSITASLMPHDRSFNAVVTVQGAGGTGGGSAGGSTSGGGTTTSPPQPRPCSVVPGSFGLLSLLWLAWRRRG